MPVIPASLETKPEGLQLSDHLGNVLRTCLKNNNTKNTRDRYCSSAFLDQIPGTKEKERETDRQGKQVGRYRAHGDN